MRDLQPFQYNTFLATVRVNSTPGKPAVQFIARDKDLAEDIEWLQYSLKSGHTHPTTEGGAPTAKPLRDCNRRSSQLCVSGQRFPTAGRPEVIRIQSRKAILRVWERR